MSNGEVLASDTGARNQCPRYEPLAASEAAACGLAAGRVNAPEAPLFDDEEVAVQPEFVAWMPVAHAVHAGAAGLAGDAPRRAEAIAPVVVADAAPAVPVAPVAAAPAVPIVVAYPFAPMVGANPVTVVIPVAVVHFRRLGGRGWAGELWRDADERPNQQHER